MNWEKYPLNIVNAVDRANIYIRAARYRWIDYDMAQMGFYGDRGEPDFAGDLDQVADDLRKLREETTDRASRALLMRTINRVAAEKERILSEDAARTARN